MIGTFNLANNENNVQIFYTIGNNIWQTWQKPKGCKYAQFLVIGSGGGGGGGGSRGVGTTRSGGAGGGSSGVSRLFVPLSSIPDVLYIQVGVGGLGGAAFPAGQGSGDNGGAGQLSYVSIQPNIAVANVLVASGNAPNSGGSGGSGFGSGVAIAGGASTIFTVANGLLSHIGHFNFIAGQAGGNGGNASGQGTAITLAGITSGGAGGAGVSTTNLNGANVTGAGFVPTRNGGVATTSQADSGFNSFNGKLLNQRLPLFFTGGAGGYSNNLGTGGDGGYGAFGCGGGGAGAGTTGGRGGNGGDGLVIITCW